MEPLFKSDFDLPLKRQNIILSIYEQPHSDTLLKRLASTKQLMNGLPTKQYYVYHDIMNLLTQGEEEFSSERSTFPETCCKPFVRHQQYYIPTHHA